ncbi:MAG: sporulation protein [Rheinheimera sp.]|uniref:SPOR domain-containing protein n=1 Tax=Arsukibacterium sp. UBA3155 TaxID=1946058 RepID=UPI000C8AEEB2|nr:SPOR domain-containing protein [Arsukibacterium sp. UBA3155]MAD76270.1 sporulation protein [Rheinheimera sp.]|tara:strand:- start:22265 stop:22840 length:576 start_codon:yes stop_codon:yes gene_type:complete
MPQKDYVKTARPKPKAKPRASAARRGNSRATSKANRHWLLMLVTAILLSGFAGFLWYLKQQPSAPADTPADVSKSTAAIDDLPVKPVAEPYQYIKELENKEVQVEVDTTEREKQGPFQMQCGSFRQAEQAEAMRAQIAFAGYASAVRRTEGSNGVWYRVVLGPYDSKRQATADRNRLQQQNINGCRIWNWT